MLSLFIFFKSPFIIVITNMETNPYISKVQPSKQGRPASSHQNVVSHKSPANSKDACNVSFESRRALETSKSAS